MHWRGMTAARQTAEVTPATELILLGTAGGPTPKLTRSAPAQVLRVGGRSYVVDCGNAVAHQLVRAGVPLDTIEAVFLTHHHSDHNADYGTLLLLAWASDLVHPVTTVGPPPLAAMTESCHALNAMDNATPIAAAAAAPAVATAAVIRPREVTGPGVVYEDDRVRVSAVLVDHPPIPVALGYRFDTADRSIVFSGDTAPSAALAELAEGADVLVHECIHLPAISAMLAQDAHATRLREHLEASHTSPADAGAIAEKAGVTTLVLSHLVPADAGLSDDDWRSMAAETFSGEIVVGADLMAL